jgi:hypothetical protein
MIKEKKLNATDQLWEVLSINFGLSIDHLKSLTPEQLDQLVEKRMGKRKFSISIGNLIPRGNPLLALGKFIDYERQIKRFNQAFK